MILKNVKNYHYILLLFLLSCKQVISSQRSNNDVYYTVFSELEDRDNCLNKLYKEYLSKKFSLCAVTVHEKTVYTKYPKAFLEVLASDFDNQAFLKVKNLKTFSVLSLKEKQEYNDLCISIEKLDFINSEDALSAFNSLKDYSSREIHFNTLNWIWLLQQNSLYRISSRNHNVTSLEMQTIKKDLKTLLKRKGEVYVLSFLE